MTLHVYTFFSPTAHTNDLIILDLSKLGPYGVYNNKLLFHFKLPEDVLTDFIIDFGVTI